MPKKIAVIDGNSLMHRAYHAVPDTMNAPDGTPTNAVFGFISMFLKFYEETKPDAIVCAFDAGKPTYRIEALESYKAQRPPMDEQLKVQFPVVESLLEAMNVPIVKVKGWEGDDILGTISARDEKAGYETLLVTGDKDAYQLVTDRTRVVTTKKGISDVAIYGPDEVVERYGVTAAQFPDFLGLKGDSADNIPGVPGIGDKGAARLLQKYGSIDGIYEHIDELKGKQKENLVNNRDAAYLSRELAIIVRDLDFDIDLESLEFPSFDQQKVTDAFHAVRFNAHLARVLALEGGSAQAATLDLGEIELVSGEDADKALSSALSGDELVGVECVQDEQGNLFGAACTLYVGADGKVLAFEGDRAAEVLADIVRNGRFCALDVKHELHTVYPVDSADEAIVSAREVMDAKFFDLSLAGYLLDSSASGYTWDSLSDAYLGAALPEPEKDQDPAVVHVAAAARLAEALGKALDEDGTRACYDDIDLPLVPVLTVMERVGTKIDTDTLARMGEATKAEMDQLRAEIYDLAGEEFNVDSPKQLSEVLFDKLGLPHGKKRKTGYATDAKTLDKLRDKHPIVNKVLRYRELAKMESTYIDTLPGLRSDDGRVHTSFNQTVTTTGRLSSSDPNLQNIPVRTDFGRKVRECFVPLREGDVFMGADYSQIELRLLAHLSGDEHLVEAFRSGADFHAATAARVFGVPVEEVTPQLRSRAKAVNFGIVYGQQAFGLAQSLKIGYGEAQEMIDRYFEAYPQVRTFLDDIVAQAARDGYATTMFGRKRHIPELASKNAVQRGFGERTAMNHPMQGSAADIIKMAMRVVQDRLIDGGYQTQLMVQVHDELDFSVPRDEIDAVSQMAQEVMSGIVELKVPLVVDVEWGDNWAQAH